MFARFKNFLLSVRAEFKKVVWPTRKKTLRSTGVVLIFCTVMTAFLGISNSILLRVVQAILG